MRTLFYAIFINFEQRNAIITPQPVCDLKWQAGILQLKEVGGVTQQFF